MKNSVQGTLDELGTPLSQVTFVVFDLETTGGSAAEHAITEIGAVKVRGGEVLGEFSTLVDPGAPIPPFISVLTGITDSHGRGRAADRVGAAVVPGVRPRHHPGRPQRRLRHWASSRRPAPRTATPRPANPVVDTVDLARRLLTRDEAPNCKLSTLARFFRSPTEPCHRALADARATVRRAPRRCSSGPAPSGCTPSRSSSASSARPPPSSSRKRHLADVGAAAPPASTCSRTTRGERPLRRQEHQPAQPRPLLLHRRRDPARASAR